MRRRSYRECFVDFYKMVSLKYGLGNSSYSERLLIIGFDKIKHKNMILS